MWGGAGHGPDGGSERARPCNPPLTSSRAIQIQGNTATPDEEVRRLADVRVGMPFEETTVDAVAARLRTAKKFDRVEVRKRFRVNSPTLRRSPWSSSSTKDR